MSTLTSQTAPTWFLEAGGSGSPTGGSARRVAAGHALVFFNHFRGNLDTFDPAITGAFAADREVVLFDNAGVGQSTGPAGTPCRASRPTL